jgi:hypothetical protein
MADRDALKMEKPKQSVKKGGCPPPSGAVRASTESWRWKNSVSQKVLSAVRA